MASLDTPAVAALLREYGQRLALRGGNPFRAKAFSRAADSLGALAEPLERMIAQGRLKEIPGVGDAIAGIIARLHAHGTHAALEAMRSEIPAGVLEMLAVPGLRPDKVMKLYKELGIASLAALEAAAREGRIAKAKGLGAALQTKILRHLEITRDAAGRMHMHRAASLLDNAQATLRRTFPELTRITAAGDFRRGCELIGDFAVVAQAPAGEGGHPVLRGGTLAVHLADEAHYGAVLLFATGSSAHLAALQARAAQKGMQLGPDGLRRRRKTIAAKTEEEIYAALGLPFIPPELREGSGEIERAIAGKFVHLVGDDDVRGILHAHTDASDGVDPLEAIAEATQARGYQYFGVADHSKSAHYARGLSVAQIAAQHRAIDRLNKRFDKDFRIFKGIESDILADGALDYPDAVLGRFDFVVASVHSRFKMEREQQTARIIRAVANPHTTILGHMTGRQLLRRPGYDLDVEKVLAACAEHGVAVEINANPWRLDLDWRWHQRALDLGCMMSINPDAHSTREIDLTHWGVEMARKGGVPTEQVLNCLTLQEIIRYFNRRRSGHVRAA
jgi:DNA polymerase (family X)